MKIYGIQQNNNPILIEVISAEIDIFMHKIIFKTASRDIWSLQFRNQSQARFQLRELLTTGLLVVENDDDPRYMLIKEK